MSNLLRDHLQAVSGHYRDTADPFRDDLPNIARQGPTPLQQQMPPHQAQVEAAITHECADIAALLISKNRQYGNSALNPLRVFSRAPTVEQILVRIDDKLSRIRTRSNGLDTEDTVQDLIGYLVLLRLAERGVT